MYAVWRGWVAGWRHTFFRLSLSVVLALCWRCAGVVAHTFFSASASVSLGGGVVHASFRFSLRCSLCLGGGGVVYLFRLSLSLGGVHSCSRWCVHGGGFTYGFSLSAFHASLTPLLSISMTIKNGI